MIRRSTKSARKGRRQTEPGNTGPQKILATPTFAAGTGSADVGVTFDVPVVGQGVPNWTDSTTGAACTGLTLTTSTGGTAHFADPVAAGDTISIPDGDPGVRTFQGGYVTGGSYTAGASIAVRLTLPPASYTGASPFTQVGNTIDFGDDGPQPCAVVEQVHSAAVTTWTSIVEESSDGGTWDTLLTITNAVPGNDTVQVKAFTRSKQFLRSSITVTAGGDDPLFVAAINFTTGAA